MYLLASVVGTREHIYKIVHEFSNIEYCRRFFGLKVVGIWNSLSNHLVTSDCVNSFKSGLHGSLGNLLFQHVDWPFLLNLHLVRVFAVMAHNSVLFNMWFYLLSCCGTAVSRDLCCPTLLLIAHLSLFVFDGCIGQKTR